MYEKTYRPFLSDASFSGNVLQYQSRLPSDFTVSPDIPSQGL